MLPNFKLIKDWFITTNILGVKNKTLILTEGITITPTETGEYHIIYGGWSEENPRIGGRMILNEENMESATDDTGHKLFEKINPFEPELIIQEIPEDDDTLVKNWRIQLDVKTTRKKLKDIELMIKDKVLPLL